MNYMNEVRKMLKTEDGQTVAEGEVFVIEDKSYHTLSHDLHNYRRFRFTAKGKGFEEVDEGNHSAGYANDILYLLITGEKHIMKLPFRPKYDEFFYFPLINAENELKVCQRVWTANIDDFAMLKAGWVFRTKEECEKALPRIQAEIEKMREEME